GDAAASDHHRPVAKAIDRCGAGIVRPRYGFGASRKISWINSKCTFTGSKKLCYNFASALGGIAQLGERLHGMQEVSGSIPLTSTNPESLQQKSPSSRGLGHRPFTAVTGVRIPVGTPPWHEGL